VRIGADTGGTFTDLVGTDGRVLKVRSTPIRPGDAILNGVRTLAPASTTGVGAAGVLAHGTTVPTNALLQRRGARIALYTTDGFRDVIEIARQDRPSLYDPWTDRPPPLVGRDARIEVRERLAADGTVLVPLDVASVSPPPAGTDAVAVCFLHSDLNGEHETALAARLEAAGWDVSCSHHVSPEFREYERTVTTAVNAFLRPVCRDYLAGLAGAAGRVVVSTSAAGLVDVHTAAALPAALLLSGPAAGARAAGEVAAACGFPDAVTFDMGGTSTDVCLVLDGRPALTSQHTVAGLPIRMPAVDVHTIGAGGGSIARLDAGGALVVGPDSAGADPGPACYGFGGSAATVTDADVVTGRIPADSAFSGLGRLDVGAARSALDRSGVDADGVLQVVHASMEQAVRAVSVERGVDPAGLALVAFGGAGPVHACDLADAVGIPVVVVPAAAGVLSAVGLVTADLRRDVAVSRVRPADHSGLADEAEHAANRAWELVAAEGVGPDGPSGVAVEVAFDCRYVGQSHELTVSDVDAFHDAHRRRNGTARPADPVEVTTVRASARLPSPVGIDDVLRSWEGRWERRVVGPDVVVREDCTIFVPDGWAGEEGPLGSLVLRRTGERS
jgi:N-methylhydantoinase A/oxoprolinase/acetone carboxylase beta subunit